MSKFLGPTDLEECGKVFGKFIKVQVIFKKKNGDERTMVCTRRMGLIPKKFHPKGEPKPPSEAVFPVYDMEAEGWRSFSFDSVISMEGVI